VTGRSTPKGSVPAARSRGRIPVTTASGEAPAEVLLKVHQVEAGMRGKRHFYDHRLAVDEVYSRFDSYFFFTGRGSTLTQSTMTGRSTVTSPTVHE